MDARTATTVGELLRRIPAEGTARDLALHRLTDLYAVREADAALHAASARGRETLRQHSGTEDAVVNALLAASALREAGPVTGELGDDFATDAVRRDQLAAAILDPAFLAVIPTWVSELRQIAATDPATGACTVASAMQLWSWSVAHVQRSAERPPLGLSDLAQAFSGLIAARAQVLEIVQEARTSSTGSAMRQLYTDLCHVVTARASGDVARVCAEVVFGYRTHPAWDAEGCASCYRADDLDALEGWIPGIASTARGQSDVIEQDGSHPAKAGPCVRTDGLETFIRLRAKLDGCLTGARLAKDRAAAALPSLLTSPAAATR